MTLIEVQRFLRGFGFDPGVVDGLWGNSTLGAVSQLVEKYAAEHPISAQRTPQITATIPSTPAALSTNSAPDLPAEWMPDVKMERIIFHWTAGSHVATEFDRQHYHVLINADGRVVRGIPTIDGNAIGGPPEHRASHTLNCNTGSIGVSMACMAGAIEHPFNAGTDPLTKAQWDECSSVLAALCRRYKIPVTDKTVLSHAEVQVNLNITQRGKWDIAILPFDPTFDTARKCGDRMRSEVTAKL